MIDDKEFVFDIVQSVFKEITSNFQRTFIVYEDYKNKIKKSSCTELLLRRMKLWCCKIKKKYEGSNYVSFCSNATNWRVPCLLNMTEDYGYSLWSITDHTLSYVSLNWKRDMETSVNAMISDMGIIL